MSTAQAYDQARQEFYALRHQEDVERRIAKEEAEATGAYFGKSMLEISMGIEDKVYENWKQWAHKEITVAEQLRDAAYTGTEPEPVNLPEEDQGLQDGLASLDNMPEPDAQRGGAVNL